MEPLPSKPRTVFTPAVDFVAFVVPVLLGIAFVPSQWLILPDKVPGWCWLFLVVAVDVAHVWATVFRTYLDKRELFRRPKLYLLVPVYCFVISFLIHYFGSSSLFWTAISYAAIYHFIKQDLGLLFLYIARNTGRVTKQQIDMEKWTLYTGAICPVLLWHARPPEAFHWFRANERFLFHLPEGLVLPVQGTCMHACTYACMHVHAREHIHAHTHARCVRAHTPTHMHTTHARLVVGADVTCTPITYHVSLITHSLITGSLITGSLIT